jgi:hypothetical protein
VERQAERGFKDAVAESPDAAASAKEIAGIVIG